MRTSTTIILASLVVGITMTPQMSRAEQSLIPTDMVYVGHGPSVMGLDKEEPAESDKTLTPYERRMNTPWSGVPLRQRRPARDRSKDWGRLCLDPGGDGTRAVRGSSACGRARAVH